MSLISYDIGIYLKAEDDGFELVDEPELSSPTYNLRDMFVACMDWNYEQHTFYPAKFVLEKLIKGIEELSFHHARYERYDPSNGWGDIDGALEALKLSRDSIINNARHYSIEKLYYRW